MQLKMYIKDKTAFIALNIFVSSFSAFLLYMVEAKLFFMFFIPCVYLSGCAAVLMFEYISKSSYYNNLYSMLESLDKKTLLSEIAPKPNFYESHILYDILKTTGKAMNDEIAGHSLSSAEYREYIELWVHEIKTPIAGAKLMCENSGNNAMLDSLQKIDKFVEQALFYSRSNTVEKDYIIKQAQLKELVNRTLRKNAKRFIGGKISMETESLDFTVPTDVKWTDFILEQILDNAIKYESKKIKIYAEQNDNSISLFIRDDGIGIPNQDISRVFDKGFTGDNGRKYAKSTGLGLYLCKKLCLKLGLNIYINSEHGKGTVIEIVFPKSSMYNLTKV